MRHSKKLVAFNRHCYVSGVRSRPRHLSGRRFVRHCKRQFVTCPPFTARSCCCAHDQHRDGKGSVAPCAHDDAEAACPPTEDYKSKKEVVSMIIECKHVWNYISGYLDDS